jgi:murein DD-endopeptidase MepM/ murein hydrolase activator NlpD
LQQPPPEPGFQVLVVPEKGARVTRLDVSATHVLALTQLSRFNGPQLRRLAWIGGSIAFVLLGTAAGMAWRYFQVVGRAVENAELREENLELKAKLAAIQEKIAHINESLARVKHLNANLQNITQLKDPERGLAISAEAEGRGELNPTALADSLDQLAQEAAAQEETLRALTGYFEDQQALLASAPAIWPARGWVTSDFGYRLDPYTAERKHHLGLDIANAVGTPIVAPADGTCVYAAFESGYGNVVVLDHGNGIKTRYGHLKQIDVRVGDRVRRGDLIGQLGNTGRSTGPHLHYEVRINGVPENPRKFILESEMPNDPLRQAGARRAMGGVD